MQGTDWDRILSDNFGKETIIERDRNHHIGANWDDSLQKSFGFDVDGHVDRHHGHVDRHHGHQDIHHIHNEAPDHGHHRPEAKRSINLLDFISNQESVKPVGPPTSTPSKPTLYGPWEENGEYLISVWDGANWKHLKLYSSTQNNIEAGVYGGSTLIPVLEFDAEGKLVKVTSTKVTLDISNLPYSGAVPGHYGGVDASYIKVPSFDVNEKGIIGEITEMRVPIAASQDKTFVFNQNQPLDVWEIRHTLNKFPSITVVDSAGSIIIGEVHYNSINSITVKFSGGFSGQAFLN
jgi:hypothetical protein